MTALSTMTQQDPGAIRYLTAALLWRARSVMAPVAAVCLAFASSAVPGSAFASSHAHKSLPFDEGFREATSRMLQGMSDGSCYVNRDGGKLKMAFVGIPPNNVHFSESLRANLNHSAKKSIERYFSWNIDLLAPEAFETIAKQTGMNASDQVQLRKAVEKIRNVPLVYVIHADRPAKNVAQLKLELFARADEGVQVCPKTETLFVDLQTNRTIPEDKIAEVVTDEPVVERRWAFVHALRQAAPAIRNFKSIVLDIDYQMAGSCRLRNRSEVAFRSDYSDVEREMLGRFGLSRGEWPTLRVETVQDKAVTGDAAADQATLKIQFALDGTDPDLMDLTVQLNRGGQSLLTRFMRVLVKPSDLVGCKPFSTNLLARLVQETRSTSQSFSLHPSQPSYTIKTDEVSIEIRPTADRYFYCWIVAPDQTAYVLLPWSEDQLAKPWKAGTSVRYPDDFMGKKAGDVAVASAVIYQTSSKELFGCFAAAKRLPAKLETRWVKMHYRNGGGGGPQGVVTSEAVSAMIADIRRVKGVEENYAWIVAVE